ncbi:hypothetical protein QBC33DRAFT_538690 [Phialemonium atrogriseum]|uniref:Uncharacterized protein n=1 Tax=Phialemonium atrogriseum TaxID=1093897 RepID=A0AAJ0FNX1_9PEZI|nr:uncharacterized protein QBC33DRAFT_538690 [Phialemonium atrogriseum]KAK1767595.1 hypothetical protein QBC33DRAFT_538690 [Phialemonium atrogriseum]
MAQHNKAQGAASSPQDSSPDQPEVSGILKGLKQDLSLMGCIALGKDGVLRSLTADRDVVDAIGLNPDQIARLMHIMLPHSSEFGDDYEGVDGTKVPKEAWFEPDKGILPPPLSEEARERSRKAMEENPDLFQRKREELRQAWEGSG